MANLTGQQAELLSKDIIDIQGPIDEDTFEYVRECMLELAVRDNPDIQVNINSGGGHLDCGFLIYDLFRLYPGRIVGVVVGKALSCALIVLQGCDTRQCSRNSFTLLHQVARANVEISELEDPKEFKKLLDSMQKRRAQIYSLLTGKTGKSFEEIDAACKEARQWTAEESLEFGLIDKIV